jgi:hypothetical protein
MLLEFDSLQMSRGEVLAVFGSSDHEVTTMPSIIGSVDALDNVSTWSEVASGVDGSVFFIIWTTFTVSSTVTNNLPFQFIRVVFNVNNDVMSVMIFMWVSRDDGSDGSK